ncbi:MAG: DHHA1 domain-containing protein, partial [Firmicutes bacterium]|nr:DHHA1 domain-containing protein [Bacillota bacterium]
IMVDLKNRRVGLRSRQNGVDVSEIAKAFDGGGHQAAAGFQLSPLILAQLNELLFGKDSES